MKVVKWGVHGTGTCIGPGILLSVVANIPMDPEGAAGSMLFRGSSRCEAPRQLLSQESNKT